MRPKRNRIVLASFIGLLGFHLTAPSMAEESNLIYSPVEPCRIFDTRGTGSAISAGTSQDFYVYGDSGTMSGQGGDATGCSAPHGEPVAVHLNITVVPLGSGHIRVYPKGTTLPNASTINYSAGINIANAITVKSSFDITDSDISIYSSNSAHVLADVQGYYYPKLKNVITVSTQYADFTSPIDAINSIPTTGPNIPSATNPYLIEIGPGTYNLGSTQLVMKEWVDIKGTGSREATILTGAVTSSSISTTASLVIGASNAELNNLTITNTGGGTVAVALGIDATSPKIRGVKARASGGSNNVGIFINNNAQPALSNTLGKGSGGVSNFGVYISNSTPSMKSVTATANGGTNNSGAYITGGASTLTFDGLKATADGGAGSNNAVESLTSATTTITNSNLVGEDSAMLTGPTSLLTIVSSTIFGGAAGTTSNNRCFFVTDKVIQLDANCLAPP